jgi:hypothetical protein
VSTAQRLAPRTVLAIAIVLVVAGRGWAAQYQAWGDSGWGYTSKRECCNAALAIAQDYSATMCLNTGGTPRPPLGGGQRGSCTSEFMQDPYGTLLYRCYGEAALWCR